MTLREKQSLFMRNLAKLIAYAYDELEGYELTGGELMRTQDQQMLYFEGLRIDRLRGSVKLFNSTRKSKTMFSDHLKKLAIDLNVFVDGKYRTDKEAFRPLHEFWKSLHPDNYSGYEWGWDYNHFGTKE
jgi:hypothetical protein